ncbi:prominin-like protein isoform X2 [Copidosoma floridanum]|uniref:prominin-like protein isoform X2 n=1 Tax=Copidosoma floridanum TaxID=29053 RepID=UPI0006C9479E|nr:prominin-like protein isoform X2 [Copidosoma floridanum]
MCGGRCSSTSWAMAVPLVLVAILGLLVAEATTTELGQRQLERRLNETIGAQPINYTVVNNTGVAYRSNTKYHHKGMKQLYNITNMFIDFVQDKQAYPEGMIRLDAEKAPKFADPRTEWRIILTHYGGITGLALAGVLLAAVLPCVGLFFCCCRCVGRCGARSEPFDKKHDHCRKIFFSSLLIGASTCILFGVVCAFVTNEYMQDGTRELPESANVSLQDVKLYLRTTRGEIDTLLKDNYHELELALNNILQASGKIVTEQLAEYSNAVSLMNLDVIVSGLGSISKDLKSINEITRNLRNNASRLDIFVRRVKGSLLKTLNTCVTPECKDAVQKYKINQMKVEAEFDKYLDRYFPKLPDQDVTKALNNISQLLNDSIVEEVRRGRQQFMSIQREIQQSVNHTIPDVSASIKKAGESFAEVADKVAQMIERINQDIDRNYVPKLNYVKNHINQYSPYRFQMLLSRSTLSEFFTPKNLETALSELIYGRYYLGLAISCILLTILTCLVFGLLCGICGKRPDGYGEDCCDKGTGACFLMIAVWLIFLVTSVLMIITVAHMITGVLSERAICEPLKNPNDNRMFELVNDLVEVKRLLYPKNDHADINISHILNSCHKNETIYKVLKLQYIIDVDTLRSYTDRYDINKTIQKLEEKISLSGTYEIISKEAKMKLNALADSGLSDISFDQYTEHLKENITNINLQQLAEKLRDLASKLPRSHNDIKEELLKNAYDLEGYHRDIVIPMANLSHQLSETAMELQEHIKFNHSSMADAIYKLIKEVDKAQDFITKEGPKYVKMLAAEFGKAFIHQVNGYLNYVINSTLTRVGKCGPISNAYNATIVAGCNKILDPFNGFWVSVGWCLVLFIPTIILCVKLSALYQKSDPYPGPLVNPEYLYDAYADRDNVPLAHIEKKYAVHGRHHGHHGHPGGGYPESYDGPAVGYTDRERITDGHQCSSHHPDTRYSDIAPNSRQLARNKALPNTTAKQNKTTKVFSVELGKSQNWDFPNGGPPRYQPTTAVAPPLSTEYERPPPYYYPGPGDRN